MDRQRLQDALVELIARTSTDLPADVEAALTAAQAREATGSGAREALGAMLQNVRLAREKRSPICQDTGMLNFFVRHPRTVAPDAIRDAAVGATRLATEQSLLRPNVVAVLGGRNTGDNIGGVFPYFAFEAHEGPELTVDLLLKGGGSENVGNQRRLPEAGLRAGRDLDGVRRVVIDMVHAAQGFGCAPGVIGIGVGGDRMGSFAMAKKQLLRPLDDRHPEPEVAALETRLATELNELGVGPMGFGGATTVLGVKVGVGHRHPATFFVSMAYFCWAARRRRLTVAADESWSVN